MTPASQPAGRPRLVVRVGITGHRDLGTPPVIERLARRLRETFVEVRDAAEAMHREDAGRSFSDAPPLLCVVSPLALGADQLAAAIALDEGWDLQVVLPFAEAAYRHDFEGAEADALYAPIRAALPVMFGTMSAMEAFSALLARAGDRVLALVGNREDPGLRDASYLLAGREVVDQCDLLIAVWNGDRAAGVGGTGDVVAHALAIGTGVIWLRPSDPDRLRWGTSARDLLEAAGPAAARSPDTWRPRLHAHLRTLAAAGALRDRTGGSGTAPARRRPAKPGNANTDASEALPSRRSEAGPR